MLFCLCTSYKRSVLAYFTCLKLHFTLESYNFFYFPEVFTLSWCHKKSSVIKFDNLLNLTTDKTQLIIGAFLMAHSFSDRNIINPSWKVTWDLLNLKTLTVINQYGIFKNNCRDELIFFISVWKCIQNIDRLRFFRNSFDWWTFHKLNRKYKVQNKCLTGMHRTGTLEK